MIYKLLFYLHTCTMNIKKLFSTQKKFESIAYITDLHNCLISLTLHNLQLMFELSNR